MAGQYIPPTQGYTGLNTASTTIYSTSGYSPSFSWQVGSDGGSDMSNIFYRATIRPLNGMETYSRIPNNQILYEKTGIQINSIAGLGTWTFDLNTNASITGGPFRNYQVVIEAHDVNGNTSAGNIVGGNSNENGWVAYNQGYDIVAVSNPRQTGIEIGNSLPTVNDLASGDISNNTGNYSSNNFLGSNGEVFIVYNSGQFNSNLVGGYLYCWTGQFPKYDTLNQYPDYTGVTVSNFDFDPKKGYIYHPTAALNFRGASYLYVSVSFYDILDKIAIKNGLNVSSGLYLSDNAIIYNDAAVGTLSIGGWAIQSAQYNGNADPATILGTGIQILAKQQTNGFTSVLYCPIAQPYFNYGNNYTGILSTGFNGMGGNAVLLNGSPI